VKLGKGLDLIARGRSELTPDSGRVNLFEPTIHEPILTTMDESTKRRIEQLRQMTVEGLFGEEAQGNAEKWKDIPVGVPYSLNYVQDFYHIRSENDAMMKNPMNLVIQYIIVAYRDAKRINPEVANALLNSMIADYPDIPDTCVYSSMESLMRASSALKAVIPSKNYMSIQQQSLKVAQSYNEFLNKLLGFFLAAVRVTKGQPPSKSMFSQSYADKLKEFERLTGGENGVYFFLFRIAQPDLRNAIAHDTIWFDREKDTVRYTNKGKESEISLEEFMAYTSLGSHLPHAYTTALCAITVMEHGSFSDAQKLPKHLIHAFNHDPQV
jgi:hypothetical protein